MENISSKEKFLVENYFSPHYKNLETQKIKKISEFNTERLPSERANKMMNGF